MVRCIHLTIPFLEKRDKRREPDHILLYFTVFRHIGIGKKKKSFRLRLLLRLIRIIDVTGVNINFSTLMQSRIVGFKFVECSQEIAMTAERTHRNVCIAMDGSEYSDYAFDCKFL